MLRILILTSLVAIFSQAAMAQEGLGLPPGWPQDLPKSPEQMTEADWGKLTALDFSNWTREKQPLPECACSTKTIRLGPYTSMAVRWLTDAQLNYPPFDVVDSQLNLPSKPAGVAGSAAEEGIPIIIPTKVVIIKRVVSAEITTFTEFRIETLIKCARPAPICPKNPTLLQSRYGQKTGQETRKFTESCYIVVPQTMETGTFDTATAVEDAKKKFPGTSSVPVADYLTPPLEDPTLTNIPTRPCY